MFVTQNQFYIFVACLFFGGVTGVLFSISAAVKKCFRIIYLRIIPDMLAFVTVFFLYIIYSYKLNFPDFRPFMAAGVFVGIFLYMKSWHILLAKPAEMLYNIIHIKLKQKKEKKHERIQVQKADSIAYGRGGSIARFSSDFNDLSTVRHKRRKQRKKRVNGCKSGI